MTTTMKKSQLYGEYINPTIDQCSPKKENPLVLMAQACNNIGKELSSSSSSSPIPSKQRKSTSPLDDKKKSLKRIAPSNSSPPPQPAKKMTLPPTPTNHQPFYIPPSPFMFDSLLLHHLNKTFNSSPFFSTPSIGYSSNSAFSPSQRSPYFMDSILAPPLKPSPPPAFVCNWMESNNPDGFCGKRFTNHLGLLEHLCTSHTSSIKSSYPTSFFSSYYSPPTSVGKL